MLNYTFAVPPTVTAKGNSGATNHYHNWRTQDIECLKNPYPVKYPFVTLPDNTTLQSSAQGYFSLPPSLSTNAKHTTILIDLNSTSLI